MKYYLFIHLFYLILKIKKNILFITKALKFSIFKIKALNHIIVVVFFTVMYANH